MKIKLNQNLHGHKKGEIIDLTLCSPDDARYWRKSIRDSKIDKSVSIITDEDIKKEIIEKKKHQEAEKKRLEDEEKKKKEINKKEVKNDTAS